MIELSHRFAIVSPPSVTNKKKKQEQAFVGESGSGGHEAKKPHNKAKQSRKTTTQCLSPASAPYEEQTSNS
jgi:hypothetical protein